MLAELLSAASQYVGEHQTSTLLVLLCLFSIYKLVIYPFYVSPLRNIPGPYLHRVTELFSLNAQRKFQWIKIVDNLHRQYGDVVVLSPTSVSCNRDPKYIHDIYVKNMPKSTFYENFRNHGFKDNIFASLENDRHLKYKRLVQSLYLKLAVFNSKNATRSSINEKVRQLVDQVRKSSVTGEEPDYINARLALNHLGKGHKLRSGSWLKPKPNGLGIDVYSLFGSLAMDVVSGFELGVDNGTHLLLEPEKRDILVPHREQAGMVFWTTRVPQLWKYAAGATVRAALARIEKWQLALYAHAEENVPEKLPSENLSTLETLKKKGLQGEYAYSFLTDNIFAGHETTAIQLTYMCFELLRAGHQAKQARLRQELRDAFGEPTPDSAITDFDAVDKLPYLEALMQENLRVHTSIPGAEPRVTPAEYKVTVNGKESVLPPGTGISVQPYLYHRVESIFPSPYHWVPERWLQGPAETEAQYKDRLTEMQKYMMPFGRGVRMCLGMNIAYIEMKMALANLYWRFQLGICSDWCHVTPEGEEKPIGLGLDGYADDGTDENMMRMMDLYTTRPYHDECWLEWTEA